MDIITLESLEVRLSSELNVLNRFGKKVVVKEFTNRSGRKNLTEETKEFIGTLANFDTGKNVGEAFGVSQALVSDLKRGFNGSSKEVFDVERKSRIDSNVSDVKKKVSGLALEKLTKAIECISDDKLVNAKLNDLGAIIGSLGKVANVEEESRIENNNFVFYAPRTRNEDEYKIIEVK